MHMLVLRIIIPHKLFVPTPMSRCCFCYVRLHLLEMTLFWQLSDQSINSSMLLFQKDGGKSLALSNGFSLLFCTSHSYLFVLCQYINPAKVFHYFLVVYTGIVPNEWIINITIIPELERNPLLFLYWHSDVKPKWTSVNIMQILLTF